MIRKTIVLEKKDIKYISHFLSCTKFTKKVTFQIKSYGDVSIVKMEDADVFKSLKFLATVPPDKYALNINIGDYFSVDEMQKMIYNSLMELFKHFKFDLIMSEDIDD